MRPMAKPVKCARCGRENDPALSSCLDCGRPLSRPSGPAAPPACVRCGASVRPGYRFCAGCGAELGATPAPGALGPGAAPPPALGLRFSAIRNDGVPGAAFPLRAPASLCGRLEGDIKLSDDSTVSPRHASFTIEGDRVIVRDLGSLNGTFLRIRGPFRLAPGEQFRIGRQLLRLELLSRPIADGADSRPWGGSDPGFRMRLAQVLEGGGVGEIQPLCEGENLIGRESGEVVFPADRYVSARHARIDVAGEQCTLTDLGSSNGTFRRLTAATAIIPGDQLLVGGQLLKLEA